MKRIISIALIFSMILCGCGVSGGIKDKKLVDKVDSMSREYFESKGFVGMSVAIIKDGETSFLNYGNKSVDGEKVDKDTIYEIASLSKPFAGILLGYESLEGNIALEDPVSDYVEELKSSEFQGQKMLIKHLATHTSGLPRQPRNWRGGPNPYKNYDYEKMDKAVEKFLLKKKPGTVYQYSNFGMGMLGLIIEDINDKPYEDVLKERIFDPLNMESTAIYLSDEQQKRRARPYVTGSTEGYEWDFDALKACAGIKSTTKDLSEFIKVNIEGEIEDEVLRDSIKMAQDVYYSGQMKMGLGWQIAKEGNKSVYEHDGLSSGYTSYYGFNKDEKVGVIILCNSSDGVIPLGKSIIKVLMEQSHE